MGNLMVDRFVPCAFALAYRRPVDRYTARRLARYVRARRQLRKLPWLANVPSFTDISTVVFADDIRVVHATKINVLSNCRKIPLLAVSEAQLAGEGYTQYLGNAELLPRLQVTTTLCSHESSSKRGTWDLTAITGTWRISNVKGGSKRPRRARQRAMGY